MPKNLGDPNSHTTCEFYFYGITGQKLATYTCAYADYDEGDGRFYISLKNRNEYFAGTPLKLNGWAVRTDRLGSVRWNEIGGGQHFNYYPYGEERGTTANGWEKFGSYFRDPGSGALDYADQRYYDPTKGRFSTPDRYQNGDGLAQPGGWNRFAYVGGDPVNFNDPSGLNRAAVECPNDPTTSNCSDPALGGGGFPTGFALIQSELNAYMQMVNDAVAAAAAHAFDPPDPNCVQVAIGTAAGNVGLNLGNFTGVGIQIAGTANGSGTYGETELNLTGSVDAVAALEQQMCDLGFYNNGGVNGGCQNNNSWLVGTPHSGYSGNFRSPGLTNSVQVNTGTVIDPNGVVRGIAQIDVDPYNPAAAPILGLIMHGVLQVLPNKISGGDNTYGCK
jgi:RHS repeat-associated protein